MKETPVPAGLERRKEDYELITGRGHYADDVKPPQGSPATLHMVVVRSPYAHARINSINLEAARRLPGVVAAFSGAELVSTMPIMETISALPGLKLPQRRPLALNRVRYVGDPVAVVLAEDRYIAEDARDLVEVDYEPLPAVLDPEAALAPDAPLLYEEFGSNIALQVPAGSGDIQAAFEQADHVVRLRLINQRVAPSSLEGRACLFDFDVASGQLLAWISSQTIYQAHSILARFLGLDRSQIRVYNAQVGGGFGAKVGLSGEEIVAAALAVKYGRPVKWIEDRSENLQAQTHGRGQMNYIEAAVLNPLGAKGVGEAGCIGAPPTIVNAVLDALSPLGIETIDMPLRPEKVWTLVQAASQGTLERVDPTPPRFFSASAGPKPGEASSPGSVSSVDV